MISSRNIQNLKTVKINPDKKQETKIELRKDLESEMDSEI